MSTQTNTESEEKLLSNSVLILWAYYAHNNQCAFVYFCMPNSELQGVMNVGIPKLNPNLHQDKSVNASHFRITKKVVRIHWIGI